MSYEGNLKGTYTYNGLEQLITRVIANSGSLNGTVHTIHAARGNIVAETDGTGQTNFGCPPPAGRASTLGSSPRASIWLPDAGYAGTDLSVAVVADVDTVSPVTYYAHTDHLGRPVKLTNSAKSAVWDAVWLPFGGAHSITGTLTHEHRLPGQWFQLEASLHYNWHRQYDPSIGRYTQPDPLGFVDGPSQYAYAVSSPLVFADPDGRFIPFIPIITGAGIGIAIEYFTNTCATFDDLALAGAIGAAGGGGLRYLGGPLKAWLRIGNSFSKSNRVHTVAIRWGSNAHHSQQIRSSVLRNMNQALNNSRVPINNWRSSDPGHFHLWIR